MSSSKRQNTDVIKHDQRVPDNRTQGVLYSHIHSGPLPSPEILQGYESVLPGAADRIIAMAEKQAQHRQEIEKIAYRSESRNSFTGVVMAGAVVVLISVPAILSGNAVIAGLLGSAGLVGLAGAFIYGTRAQQKQKQKQVPKEP
ncbi:MAG: DUF2335 domain-containing protein [Peptococcaceae bacterium]|jgi:uncharacterized membrane protein|nr:DUF2335 domain-containing protein [Peptococcaceae bacterium]